MKSRYLVWLMSISASVALFLGQRLSLLGQVMAHQLERPCGGYLDERVSQRMGRPIAGRRFRAVAKSGEMTRAEK